MTDAVVRPDVAGRHEAAEAADAPDALNAADAVEAAAADSEQPEATDPPQQRERATQADLRLLREHPALRARCVAAALAPFVIYTVVLFALARVHIYVLWLWAPIIAAGILVGAVLDAAHKRIDRAAGPPNVDDSAQA